MQNPVQALAQDSVPALLQAWVHTPVQDSGQAVPVWVLASVQDSVSALLRVQTPVRGSVAAALWARTHTHTGAGRGAVGAGAPPRCRAW